MDTITVEILEDGTLKTSTDVVSAANHGNAEKFLLDLGRGMGGNVKRIRKGHTHTHSHAHSHAHGSHTHTH
jgi:hypothetical protein